jgi:hypothetical protein
MRRYDGGVYLNQKGYVRILGTNRLEHREVMERYLGRPLLPTEQVHHKNGIKHDNRLENLEVLSASTHNKITAENNRAIWAKFNAYIALHPEFLNELNAIDTGDGKLLTIPLVVVNPPSVSDHESESGH